jgi:hypothetical protein
MQVHPNDPNWLLSSAAQSAAALVAIIGGFLVSRLVAISTTRQGLKQRLQESSAVRAATQAALDETTVAIKETARRTFRAKAVRSFAEHRGSVPADAATNLHNVKGAKPADFEVWFDELADEVRSCFQSIEPKLRAYQLTVDRGKLAHQVDLGIYDPIVLDSVILTVEADKQPRATGAAAVMPNRAASGHTGPAPDDVSVEQDRRIAQVAELSARLQALDSEDDIIARQLAQVASPRGVYSGIAVLTHFALVGIVFPLALMASRPVASSLATRRLVLMAFATGLFSVVGYLFWLMSDTRKS